MPGRRAQSRPVARARHRPRERPCTGSLSVSVGLTFRSAPSFLCTRRLGTETGTRLWTHSELAAEPGCAPGRCCVKAHAVNLTVDLEQGAE